MFKEGDKVAVLLPLPSVKPYSYLVPANISLEKGDFVEVPLGARLEIGVVWGKGEDFAGRLRAVGRKLEVPSLPLHNLQFIEWVANYTLSDLGQVLKMSMSAPQIFENMRTPKKLIFKEEIGRITTERAKVLAKMDRSESYSVSELANLCEVSDAVLKAMVKAGILAEITVSEKMALPSLSLNPADLSSIQQEAAKFLIQAAKGFSVTLLDGVTGSGKTEVYFEAINKALQEGKEVLTLLPEIALSSQWLERFQARFGDYPLVWHSDLRPSERRRNWLKLAESGPKVVVGARSALFLPFKNLGLIIVDEEHEAAFKQEEGVFYHARDMAVVRANLGQIPIILVSATPSFETVVNARSGKYREISLPARFGGASLPKIELIDLKRNQLPRGRWLAPSLVAAIAKNLERREEVMLFLNRRGYAPLTLCRECGFRRQCPHCSAWLVEHRSKDAWLCHHCGHSSVSLNECPNCQAKDSFTACGPGVERIFEEVKSLFPDAKCEIMTSDTTGSFDAAAQVARRMQDGEIDILIGTQIMAKGYHFPKLTLVGVVDADLGLNGGDLRAAERTYQMLAQVTGRAGRADLPGKVMLQTYSPEHPVMLALQAGDKDNFIELQLDERHVQNMPPFGRLAGLIISAPTAEMADKVAQELSFKAPNIQDVDILGPAPAPLAILRGRHRRRLLLKSKRGVNIQKVLRDWLAKVNCPTQARIQIDIDPYSFV